MASKRGCINNPDNFCYICGLLTTKSQQKSITQLVKTAYNFYFGMKLSDQDKKWAPHVICVSCNSNLTQWIKGKGRMPYAIPMAWREPRDHDSDCYFCMTKITGCSTKNKHKIQYPDIPSAIRPVLHDETMPIPVLPVNWT